ncbi:adenylosuccinate synthetase [Agrobacterium vitis]|uniref:adenylosuccinate synthetase n=1 Tax=Allorhizobium ampelinum TaxID=3025782 RepID=UPI001F1CAE16|nr:adenylosuccinate synthetase [Allorhizobium ampelinum]MCF1461749.1 adenylosuccinate synthetase [Allorhizobium ampelinum]
MSIAYAVLGAGWGDEGKGLMTDALASAGSVVVRANGGAQAGHTVQRPDGTRHVFHHVGSGAFRGAATYMSRFFIHNPMLLLRELSELDKIGVRPSLFADPNGLVTTPWDMMINQIAEEARNSRRHGSCGLGINETIRRSERDGFKLQFSDLANLTKMDEIVRRIQKEWVPSRLTELGFLPSEAWQARLASPVIAERFTQDVEDFSRVVWPNDGTVAAVASASDRLIFEGAQGLLLDQDHAFFPHVTPSKTGIANPSILAAEWGVGEIKAIYMTRAYATRHGAGPFPRATPEMVYPDATNIPNLWQGTLRFAALDLDLLAKTILEDEARSSVRVETSFAMTCLDQVADQAVWWRSNIRETGAGKDLLEAARRHLQCPLAGKSFGPCREDVTFG